MPFAEPEDPVPASVVTAVERLNSVPWMDPPICDVVLTVVSVVSEEDELLFLAQEIMVRLKRDIRITCKIFFILSSKNIDYIANLKSHIFICVIKILSRQSRVTESSQEIVKSIPLYLRTIDLCLPYVNTIILLLGGCFTRMWEDCGGCLTVKN